jgi:hypothetical protein
MEQVARTEAVKGIIASLFASQRALRAIAPQYRWAGLGNLLGDFGEFIAAHEYQLVQAPPGSNGYDAKTKDGRSVQVKTNHASVEIGFRGSADLMLVLHVKPDGEWEEVYFGPFAVVRGIARYSTRDNKHMVSIAKLRAISKAVSVTETDSTSPLTGRERLSPTPGSAPILGE